MGLASRQALQRQTVPAPKDRGPCIFKIFVPVELDKHAIRRCYPVTCGSPRRYGQAELPKGNAVLEDALARNGKLSTDWTYVPVLTTKVLLCTLPRASQDVVVDRTEIHTAVACTTEKTSERRESSIGCHYA